MAPSAAARSTTLAQRHGGGSGGGGSGGMSCNTDADCHIRLPRPRACPNGNQSVPTACCRMNYCGICWSECSGARSDDGAPGQPLVSM